MTSTSPSTIPTASDFVAWPAADVQPLAAGKAVVFATGGTSRWYFLTHGDAAAGYGDSERFLHYGRNVLERVTQIVNWMFEDGASTVFVVGFGGGQGQRDASYMRNMMWAYELLADDETRALYDRYDMGVIFRGRWADLFAQLDAPDLAPRYRQLEAETAHRARRLVWFVPDDVIPEDVMPLALERIQQTGRTPSAAELAEAYYGRPVEQIDIFISNNKLSIGGMLPPLVEARDLYFTVSPSLFLDHEQWRHILYDHLFARRGHYRDFTKLAGDRFEEMRAFYTANHGATQGVGSYHPPSQTWRPALWPNLQPLPEDLPEEG